MTRSINISGVPFKLIIKDVLEDSEQALIDGCYDPSIGVIYLAKAASVEAMEETLLHEILHGVSDATVSKLDEDTVCRLSRALYGAGVRPPKILRKRDIINELSK